MGAPAGIAAPAAQPASKWASVAFSASAAAVDGAVHFTTAVPLETTGIMEATVKYSAVDHFSGDGQNYELMQHLKEEARVGTLALAAQKNEESNREKAGTDYDKKQAMPSRIMGANNGGTSKAAMDKARAEDDGEGWIGTANLKECVLSGKNMIGNQSLVTTGTAKDAAAKTGEAGKEEDGVAKKKKRSKNSNKNKKKGPTPIQPNTSPVGCVTTDFTMQNVMLQMNLRVVSVDGMLVRTIRQWVMRCMACYTVHTDMNRIFCSRCGVDHMSRVACSVDASTGQLRLHLKSNYQVSKRGKQYSMPAPGKQGRFEGELLTREDQLLGGIWRQKVVKMQKDVRSAFGQDVTSDVGLQVNKSVHIRPGLGRINPNADKGRERRGKSKRKK
jgi:rRNA maturation endonuclease Nob1